MRKMLVSVYQFCFRMLEGSGVGRFALVRRANDFLVRSLKQTYAEVQGHKMYLDANDSLALSVNGVYEPFETELLRKLVKPGDTVLDIGANIGYYTLILAELVGATGKVYAFEPEPTNFELLRRNVELNGYKNVVLVRKATSNKNGSLRLYLCEDNKAMHRVYESHYCGDGYVEIEAVRLDDYFAGRDERIDFIKIDIEGAEYAALEGMQTLLRKNSRAKLVTEYTPLAIKEFGVEPQEYLRLLKDFGFEFQRIDETNNRVEPTDMRHLVETYTPDKEFVINLLCTREA
ncbi:MAG TPA: FkbM family methyltransferase [Pyrinomonadaceae bacterium]|nr:FkbM family methyltransferase [Pyrinomonadaceae bacterium]